MDEAKSAGGSLLTGGTRSGTLLQPTVLTDLRADVRTVRQAFNHIEVKVTLPIAMPYGGVKQPGFGREGLPYAIEGMSELELLTYNYRR